MTRNDDEKADIPMAEVIRRIIENWERVAPEEEGEEPLVRNPGDGAVIMVEEGFEDETREFTEERRKLGLIKTPPR